VNTNIDFNSPQEEVICKSNKSKDSNKNINNENVKNISNRNIKENDEKNKEDKNEENNNNNINENNNEQIIIEKNINTNNKDNNDKKEVFNDNIKNVIEEEKNEEDPLMTYIQSNRKISDEEIKNASKLILEEIDGNLFNGKNIEINAGGMVDGRNKKDGFTIFGQKNILNEETDNQKQLVNNNDIFVPDYELNITKLLLYPYIFAIYYKKEDKSYHIRAYSGKGSDNKILFIKLYNEHKYILKQKEIISAGNIIFQVSPIENNCLEIINLTNKKAINNKQIFPGIHNKIVTIGRHKDCDFFFPKDKSFSRYQTTFQYDETKKEWSVIDGKDNKGSTNGTWIFGTHSFLIKKEMIVEILNSKIKITEIKSDNIDKK
jgi:hypothetical protein